jgi:hypothetical protein
MPGEISRSYGGPVGVKPMFPPWHDKQRPTDVHGEPVEMSRWYWARDPQYIGGRVIGAGMFLGTDGKADWMFYLNGMAYVAISFEYAPADPDAAFPKEK